VERSVAHNEKWLAWLTTEIGKLGLEVTPSVANHPHSLPPDQRQGPPPRRQALDLARLILRQVGAYGLPHALRMTVGGEEANRLVVAALAEFMARPAAP